MKPRVFVGSSREGLPVAEFVQSALSHDAEAVLWSNGVFRITNTTIEDLLNALDDFDFGVFVLLPEDAINVRGIDSLAVRDNVIFELGLFLGELGRSRVFFVAPKNVDMKELHLPSDFSGITPSTYDPKAKHPEASVATALLQLKQSIRTLGPRNKPRETVIYDSEQEFEEHHFIHKNSYIYKGDKPISKKSTGTLRFLDEHHEMQLERTNLEGRYSIELRRKGKQLPSIPRLQDPIQRIFKVSCEAKVSKGQHSVRFVLKDIEADEWTDNKKVEVGSTAWASIGIHLRAAPTVNLLFRIDDLPPSEAPSTLSIRKLKIIEVSN